MGKSWSNLKDYDFDGTKLTIFVGLKVGKINTYYESMEDSEYRF